MRRFVLNRTEDISGISGTGIVAEGVIFHDNQVALSWFGQYHSIEIHPSIGQIKILHGHEGRTVVEFLE